MLLGGIARFIVRDLLDVIDPKDQSYFRTSREARFGTTLEQVQAGRDDRLAAFRDTLLPIRLVLRQAAVAGWGNAELRRSYHRRNVDVAALRQPVCVTRRMTIRSPAWFGRMLDQYGGLGREREDPLSGGALSAVDASRHCGGPPLTPLS